MCVKLSVAGLMGNFEGCFTSSLNGFVSTCMCLGYLTASAPSIWYVFWSAAGSLIP